MTRTDVMASSRPQAVRTTFKRSGSRRALRRLVLAPLALVLTIALVGPTTAFAAAESTSGYNQTPNTPTTTTTTPSTGTSPEKETKTPTSEKTSTTPTTETAKTGTLPFTGFDLRWSLGFGLVLMGAGFAIVAVQRRQRRQDGR